MQIDGKHFLLIVHLGSVSLQVIYANVAYGMVIYLHKCSSEVLSWKHLATLLLLPGLLSYFLTLCSGSTWFAGLLSVCELLICGLPVRFGPSSSDLLF